MTTQLQDIFLTTPMVNALHETLFRWIFAGYTGGLVTGDARLGKSQAMLAFEENLNTLFKAHQTRQQEPAQETIRVFYVSFSPRDKNTIRSVFLHLALNLGWNGGRSVKTADDFKIFISEKLADAAQCNSQRRVVIIVDEAQELSLGQLSVFAELFNQQVLLRNHLVVFFVANRERFLSLAKDLQSAENRYLRERFFHNVYLFFGIQTYEELVDCLDLFEHHPIAPDLNTSVLEYYCPNMAAAGGSLKEVAEILWQEYHAGYAEPLRLSSWGMTYFTRTVTIMVRDYFPRYWSTNPDEQIQIIRHSLEASGLRPTLSSIF